MHLVGSHTYLRYRTVLIPRVTLPGYTTTPLRGSRTALPRFTFWFCYAGHRYLHFAVTLPFIGSAAVAAVYTRYTVTLVYRLHSRSRFAVTHTYAPGWITRCLFTVPVTAHVYLVTPAHTLRVYRFVVLVRTVVHVARTARGCGYRFTVLVPLVLTAATVYVTGCLFCCLVAFVRSFADRTVAVRYHVCRTLHGLLLPALPRLLRFARLHARLPHATLPRLPTTLRLRLHRSAFTFPFPVITLRLPDAVAFTLYTPTFFYAAYPVAGSFYHATRLWLVRLRFGLRCLRSLPLRVYIHTPGRAHAAFVTFILHTALSLRYVHGWFTAVGLLFTFCTFAVTAAFLLHTVGCVYTLRYIHVYATVTVCGYIFALVGLRSRLPHTATAFAHALAVYAFCPHILHLLVPPCLCHTGYHVPRWFCWLRFSYTLRLVAPLHAGSAACIYSLVAFCAVYCYFVTCVVYCAVTPRAARLHTLVALPTAYGYAHRLRGYHGCLAFTADALHIARLRYLRFGYCRCGCGYIRIATTAVLLPFCLLPPLRLTYRFAVATHGSLFARFWLLPLPLHCLGLVLFTALFYGSGYAHYLAARSYHIVPYGWLDFGSAPLRYHHCSYWLPFSSSSGSYVGSAAAFDSTGCWFFYHTFHGCTHVGLCPGCQFCRGLPHAYHLGSTPHTLRFVLAVHTRLVTGSPCVTAFAHGYYVLATLYGSRFSLPTTTTFGLFVYTVHRYLRLPLQFCVYFPGSHILFLVRTAFCVCRGYVHTHTPRSTLFTHIRTAFATFYAVARVCLVWFCVYAHYAPVLTPLRFGWFAHAAVCSAFTVTPTFAFGLYRLLPGSLFTGFPVYRTPFVTLYTVLPFAVLRTVAVTRVIHATPLPRFVHGYGSDTAYLPPAVPLPVGLLPPCRLYSLRIAGLPVTRLRLLYVQFTRLPHLPFIHYVPVYGLRLRYPFYVLHVCHVGLPGCGCHARAVCYGLPRLRFGSAAAVLRYVPTTGSGSRLLQVRLDYGLPCWLPQHIYTHTDYRTRFTRLPAARSAVTVLYIATLCLPDSGLVRWLFGLPFTGYACPRLHTVHFHTHCGYAFTLPFRAVTGCLRLRSGSRLPHSTHHTGSYTYTGSLAQHTLRFAAGCRVLRFAFAFARAVHYLRIQFFAFAILRFFATLPTRYVRGCCTRLPLVGCHLVAVHRFTGSFARLVILGSLVGLHTAPHLRLPHCSSPLRSVIYRGYVGFCARYTFTPALHLPVTLPGWFTFCYVTLPTRVLCVCLRLLPVGCLTRLLLLIYSPRFCCVTVLVTCRTHTYTARTLHLRGLRIRLPVC